MERLTTESFIIGEHFLPYAFYADATGLTDTEQTEFDEFADWARTHPPHGGYEFAHWSADGDTIEFDKCEVTGLMGRCTTLVAVYFHDRA